MASISATSVCIRVSINRAPQCRPQYCMVQPPMKPVPHPKGPRTQVIGFQGTNNIPFMVFGPKTILFGSWTLKDSICP